ncbi:MAG: hypothetical protein HY855_18720 [Burkholderiales bacterium]|nr:hypothetical protein [Burkholderiales bacterium]
MKRLLRQVLLAFCCLSQGTAMAAADEVPFLVGTWHLAVGSCTEAYRFASDGRYEGSSGTEQLTGRYSAERLDGAVAVARIMQTIETDNLGTDCFGAAINSAGRSSLLYVVLDASVTRMWLCLSATGERCLGPITRVLPADEYSVEALLDWAERTYPNLFPGHSATQWLAPYQYRYYPATGNYVGVDGSDVYVLGPLSQNTIQRVGSVEEFRCAVKGCVAGRLSRAATVIGPR